MAWTRYHCTDSHSPPSTSLETDYALDEDDAPPPQSPTFPLLASNVLLHAVHGDTCPCGGRKGDGPQRGRLSAPEDGCGCGVKTKTPNGDTHGQGCEGPPHLDGPKGTRKRTPSSWCCSETGWIVSILESAARCSWPQYVPAHVNATPLTVHPLPLPFHFGFDYDGHAADRHEWNDGWWRHYDTGLDSRPPSASIPLC